MRFSKMYSLLLLATLGSCGIVKEKHVKGVVIEHTMILDYEQPGIIHYTTKIKTVDSSIVEDNTVEKYDLPIGTAVEYSYY